MSPKGQAIRAADVFLIGPAMTWAGLVAARHSPGLGGQIVGLALAMTGVATIVYNGANWLIGQELKRQLAEHGHALAEFEGAIYVMRPVLSEPAPAPVQGF